MTHSVAPLAANLRYRRGKCQQPRMGLEEEDYSGRLCPLSEQRCGGESGGGVRGWGAGEKKFLAAAQPEARKYGALFLSQRHQPSVLARHYFTSCRGHTPSLRHTRASSGITLCVAALIYSEVLPASDPQTRPSQTERKEKHTAVLLVLKAQSYHQAVPLHDSSPSMVFNFKMKIES